jgi:hypothetical protein
MMRRETMKLLLPAILGMAFASPASADNPGEWGGQVTDAYAFASITTDRHALNVICKNNVVTIAYYVLPEKLQADLKATEHPYLVVAIDESDSGAGKVAAIDQNWTKSEKNWSLGLSGKPAKALVKKMATARDNIVVGIARVSPDSAQYEKYEVERLTARGSGKYLKPILARCN